MNKAGKKNIIKSLWIIFWSGIILYLLSLIVSRLLSEEKVPKYATDLKDHIEFSRENPDLQYFFEPEKDKVKRWDPPWLGYEAVNTINSDTLNERYEYSNYKDETTFRIINLGDSVTYGLYVDTKDNYSEILEDLLNTNLICPSIENFEVINFGVPGYDNEYMVERFIKRGIKSNPDLVIWLLSDIEQINEYYYKYKEELSEAGVPEYNYDKKGVPVHTMYKIASRKVKDEYSREEMLSYQRKVLDRFFDSYDKELLIISLLSTAKAKESLVEEYLSKHSEQTDYFAGISEIEKKKQYRLPDGHPNKEGHREIAKDLFDFLAKKYLNSCSYSRVDSNQR